MYRISDTEQTLRLFDDLYTYPGVIPIRDTKMLITLQTHNSMINFMKVEGASSLKIIKKGKKVEDRVFENDEDFFTCVGELCGISF